MLHVGAQASAQCRRPSFSTGRHDADASLADLQEDVAEVAIELDKAGSDTDEAQADAKTAAAEAGAN